jgi:hypothetical protein
MDEETRALKMKGLHDLIDKMDEDRLTLAGLEVLLCFASAIEDHNIEQAADMNDLMTHINRRTVEKELQNVLLGPR